VTRCDLEWPEHPEAATNNQYLFLNDTLVAPIFDTLTNLTGKPVPVWIPPGSWVDAWSGASVTGPKHITASQPYERIPLWHRQDGALTILADSPSVPRVDNIDWTDLTLELRVTGVDDDGSSDGEFDPRPASARPARTTPC
jgi:alpha-glucosidase (family GH31 glycosyl hydrolase)